MLGRAGDALGDQAVGAVLPEVRVADAERARVELRVETLALLCAVVLEGLEGRALQHQDAEDVQPGHGAHADVAEAPGRTRGGDGAVGHRHEDQGLQEAQHDAADHAVAQVAREEHEVDLGHVVVRHDRGEGEERERHGHERGAEAGEHGVEASLDEGRALGGRRRDDALEQQAGAGPVRVHPVGARGDDDERGGRADEERVDVHGERLHEALLGRVRDLGGRGGVRTRALAGLVGVDAALHAPLDGEAEDRAEHGVHTERAGEDGAEDLGDLVEVQEQHDQREDDVQHGHHGHHVDGERRDALHAAQDDEGQQDDHGQGHDPGGHGPRLAHGRGHAVGLHARQEVAGGEDGDDGEQDGVHLERGGGGRVLVGLLEVVRRAAAVLAGVRVALLVDLAERGLDEGRGGTEQGHDPHPEHGAGAAERDGRGDAADVAHADAAGERHHEGLEGRGAVRGVLALAELLHHVRDVHELQEHGPDGEVEADDQAEPDQGRGPDDVVHGGDEICEGHGVSRSGGDGRCGASSERRPPAVPDDWGEGYAQM